LCQRIFKLAGTTFNLGAAISAYTRDNANEFIIGKPYNELDLEDWGIGLSIASQGAGTFWRTTKFVRWFGPSMRAMPIEWAMKVADEGTKSFLRYLQVSLYNTALICAPGFIADLDSNLKMIHEIPWLLSTPPHSITVRRLRGQ
jgi:hypothetical protein